MVGHTAFATLQRVTQSLHLPCLVGRGLLFQIWFHLMTGSTLNLVGIKPGDSGMVIGYQFDEFTPIWSAEWFVALSHIYPGLTGIVSSLTHFPLEPGCEDYSFLDQAVADFEQGLDSILTDSIEIPKLDTSLDDPYAITSSVSCGFFNLVSTISDTSKLQLAPSIRSVIMVPG